MKWTTHDFDFQTEVTSEREFELTEEEEAKYERTDMTITLKAGKGVGTLVMRRLEGCVPVFEYTGDDKALMVRRIDIIKRCLDLYVTENS